MRGEVGVSYLCNPSMILWKRHLANQLIWILSLTIPSFIRGGVACILIGFPSTKSEG